MNFCLIDEAGIPEINLIALYFGLNFSTDLIFKIIGIDVGRREVSKSVRGKFLSIDEAGVRDFVLFIF